jgi:hypothetical protein
MYNSAQKQGYTVDSASGDDSFGITAIRQNAETFCIWDSLTIAITDPSDQRINIGANASGIVVTAIYDYDNSAYDGDNSAYDGTLVLNNTVFMYNSAQKQGYTVDSASGDDSFGITAIRQNAETYCIWDSITIQMTGPSDQRIDINTNASGIVVTATYDYDNSVYDGTLVLNNTVFIYNSAQKQGYTVLPVSGDDSFGITAIRQNAETFCIWDSLIIAITNPSDQRIKT